MQRTLTIRESLGQLRDRRYLSILLFGFCSGFPWVLHGTVLTLWLQESGFSRSTIGFIGAITVVYAFNWTWAPFVDRLRLPYLFERLGQRRSWILTCQVVIAVLVTGLSFTHPNENLLLVGSLALGVAISSATLDISIDAYRITLFRKEEMDSKMPFAAATSTVGYFAGWNFVGGAVAIALAGETIGLDWTVVYRIIAGFYLV
ncbi:MAG: MFS transporter, partial [Gammaproteobacteria bacterium]